LTITIAAFSVSTILIAIGVAVMLNAYLYNQELDRTELLDAVKGLRK
jgi:predicted membrane-bound mannosyltransferase